ncbi:acyl-CoA dehydrogenase family protein [Rhodococcus opacus]|uniref:acyl-CoA dehydrogenase family protein n=1 Tax=Rhodococcus opacus TaxID=37919 RepID=UPI0002A44B68|nr:acyl-CoA dehydrogenase family protein [Rhodococcus opacus]ELB88959.1 acyl-CoA dehydrogenase [Rhodococcus wratislaviensis IFP 2016]MDX5967982.1 acyl-CoA dehydrogenase family protein [Rhodococcus opacus]NKY73810.1 DNA alkylation response protein [Rhodococcus opacus]QZS59389.1 acyl-CoA dehydrogenase family protein [Rhodococcus opacus]RKM74035.1 DNA alkylation response protein [Rhodococcus opacus]
MTTFSETNITHPAPHRTHTVLNQSVPRTDVNEFTLDTVLAEGVRRHDADWATGELTDIGALVGSATFQHDAELANTIIPELKTFDRWGNRIDEVEYHPAYHRIISAAVAHGAHTSAWADPKPGANVARAAAFMMFAQIEPGHSCPISMTNAVIPSLDLQPDVAAIWKPRALSRSYTPELDAPGKASAIFGMSMTEKQGGSDVRANTTVATPAGRGGPGADYLLTGHKWFCSAPMSDAFLVLAQAEGAGGDGLSCFLLPRILPDGTRNVFRIQRLKNKLGNKSNASSEIELDGTVGVMVGEPGRGVRTIIEMVARTRLDCVLGSTAGMRQSVAEAVWHARHRSAFGKVLADQPAMTSVLADLALESEAATVTALRLARAHDDDANEQERSFRRLATAVAKYWICKRGPQHAYEALECLGGNGYTEDFPLARRYREQPVMAVWEGSGNVIALDVLRAMTREPDSVAAFDAEVNLARGSNAVLDEHLDRVRRQLGELATEDPARAQLRARTVVESMALALQASLLVRFSPASVADAFVDARLGPDRTHEYGTLSPSADLGSILDRA